MTGLSAVASGFSVAMGILGSDVSGFAGAVEGEMVSAGVSAICTVPDVSLNRIYPSASPRHRLSKLDIPT